MLQYLVRQARSAFTDGLFETAADVIERSPHDPGRQATTCFSLIAGGGAARAQPLPRLAVVQPKRRPVDGPLVGLRLIVVEMRGATLIFVASVDESGKLVCQASEQVTAAYPGASSRSSS